MKKLIILFLFITQISFAQSNQIQEIIQEIQFKSDTIESVFEWVADNIRYDVKEVNKLKKASLSQLSSREFKNKEEKRSHSVDHALKYKKGVCEEYAALFDALLRELGYESYVIEGYTKKSNGNLNRGIGHAWNVVKVKNEWKLYDPTWGAGSIVDGTRFLKEYKPEWYDVDPEEMIKTHMPFDPIWQLKEPMRYKDFENNTQTVTSDKKYDFVNLIALHVSQTEQLQMESQLQRSLAQGDGTNILKRWRKSLSENINHHGINSKVDLLNEANDKFAQGVNLFNSFIAAQQKQFKGKKYSISVSAQNLEKAKGQVISAMKVYKGVEVDDRKGKKAIKDAILHSEKLLSEINRGLVYLAKKK